MEEHFLKDFVKGQERGDPEPWYNPDGDCIIYQMADEAIVAERVDEVLTIYNSAITGKAVGFQMKGIAALASRFGWQAVRVKFKSVRDELVEVSLSALLLAAYEEGPRTIGRRRAYAEAIDSFAARPRNARIPVTELAGFPPSN